MKRLLRKYFPLFLFMAVVVSAFGTYNAISRADDPFSTGRDRVLLWILINLLLLLALGTTIAIKLVGLWLAKRRQHVGSRLQMRLIKRFGILTVIPTLVVATLAALYFHFGVHAWFNEKVGTALNESVQVAEGYLEEHRKIITADVLAMANDLNRQASSLVKNPRVFTQVLDTQAALRSLTEAIVFQRNKVVAKTFLTFSLTFELDTITPEQFQRAANGEVVILTNSENDDRVRALIKLNNFFDTYLLVGRLVDSKVLQHVEITKGSVNEYQLLRNNVSNLQFVFSLLFGAVALLLLFVSIWYGIAISSEIVQPVIALVGATERVKGGDFETRVNEGPENDELGTLSRAFNRMTGQLEKQRSELIEVNRQIDERRHFIEAVLSGVSAGVVALGGDKRVTLINRSAAVLLNVNPDEIREQSLLEYYPAFSSLLEQAEKRWDQAVQGDIDVVTEDRNMSLHVRIVVEILADAVQGYIVTFDDITELKSAQRRAAWADVARRIAHEIKNPLTPIQLASERLKRKYRDQITTDQESFDRYLDTISRQVGDIRSMVDEFNNFARLPSPVLGQHNIVEILKDVKFSQEHVNPSIAIKLDVPEYSIPINCDRGQISQVLTNIVKNAREAIEQRLLKEAIQGVIQISLEERKDNLFIAIKDNGEGFPENLMDTITEPYVTTREKGTGLGLAIVKKIIADHGGSLTLSNQKEAEKILGASVTITFPKRQ